ncbi:MAG TPA: VOC family protein [Candidatus Merdisoma merdipullorum]|nr:VOC family protein [Candidatus Merdisoma merdipullorum]
MENRLQEYQIAHVGFVVENLEKAMERFNELYEIEDWQMVEWRPSKIVYNGKIYTDTYVRIAISLPNEGTRVEILEPRTEGFHMDVLKCGRQTINHICHVVKDFDKALQQFLDAGCELIMESEYTDEIRGFRRCHYVYDKVWNSYIEIAEIPYFKKEGTET